MDERLKYRFEEQLRKYLQESENSRKDLAAVIAEERNLKVHMQLSPLRHSLLNWYEFHPDSCLLEIHAGYGALTGLFCERCGKVTSVAAGAGEKTILHKRFAKQKNLQVLCEEEGDLQELFLEMQKKEGEYDYVAALGSIAYAVDPAQEIRNWMACLKPGGKLLLTVDNRYGLKYFCGARDPYTFVPFDGVNGYLNQADSKEKNSEKERENENKKERRRGRCLSRKELIAAIERAGDFSYQFYYPVPDSRMPQMIFSDYYQKGTNTAERLVDYNYEDKAMLGVEHRIFCEMIDSGALPFLANSFLVELTKEGDLSDIIYAVTTTDRGKAWGMATTIRTGGIVKKRALWKEGEHNLLQLYTNTQELAARGIPIVPAKLEKDSLGMVCHMPYMDEEGLSTVLKRLAAEDGGQLVRIFDEIYGYYMASSEKVQEKEHTGDKTKKSQESGINGVVLEKAYLDLAPCNCFYVKESGSLLFYDQEFVVKNCPLQFAMFRTLKYSYASAKVLEQAMPLQKMYERYGIDEKKAAAFEMQEAAFIRRIRNMEDYQHIFQWATPDYGQICERMQILHKTEETENTESEKTVKKQKPYPVGYVPGVFDLFHTGHLNLLERCKSRCDYLIVGVLTDELVEYYKGRKPVISYNDRVRIIQGLRVVDKVVPVDFSNTDKLDAWNQLHYDCHFSGDDHLKHWDDVWEELKKRGSNMEFFPYTQGISSTQLREKQGQVL